MFTGIVQSIGKVYEKKNIASGDTLVVHANTLAKKVKVGSSMSLDGICLTVSKKKGSLLWFDIMDETAAKTTIGSWKVGTQLNLEPALQVGDELGGHLVYGHVDGVGKVMRVAPGTSTIVTIRPAQEILQYIVPQGAVTVDGASLTVFQKTKINFSVSLVSYTQTHTTLGRVQKDDTVNIEVDMLLKYVDIWLRQSHSQR